MVLSSEVCSADTVPDPSDFDVFYTGVQTNLLISFSPKREMNFKERINKTIRDDYYQENHYSK